MEIPTVPANEWIATQRRAAQVSPQQRLFNRLPNTVCKKLWLCCGLLLSAFSARAEAPTPPREFWDYLMEFSDDNGEVFDPADLAVIDKVKEKIPAEKSAAEKSTAADEPKAVERNAQ